MRDLTASVEDYLKAVYELERSGEAAATTALAAQGEKALVRDPHLRHGLNIHRRRLTCAPVARALELEAITPEQALGM